MLKTLVNSLVVGAVQKRAGVHQPGALTTTLLTTGASFLFSRSRRPIGVALIAAGGLLLWHESVSAGPLLRGRDAVPPASDGVA